MAAHCRVVHWRAAVLAAQIGIGLEAQKLGEAVGVASLDAHVHGRRSSLRSLLWRRSRLQQGGDAPRMAAVARKVQRAHASFESFATGVRLGREQEGQALLLSLVGGDHARSQPVHSRDVHVDVPRL